MKRKILLPLLILSLLAVLLWIPASADLAESPPTVWLGDIYGDNMVIQRDQPIHISGYGNRDGLTVSVSLGDQSTECVTEGGRFDAVLPGMGAMRDLTLTVSTPGGNTARYRNIDIGDVYLLAGQSNMAFPLSSAEDSAEYTALADFYPHIRCFTQDRAFAFFGQEETRNGKWVVSASNTVGDFSAIGYIAATALSDELDVPIGIVTGCANSTAIQAWLDPETVSSYPSLVSSYNNAFNQMTMGTFLTEDLKSVPSAAYNRMLCPLVGTTVKAVLWYQGESNSGTADYAGLFASLVSQFRRDFRNPDLPFFVFQLAPYLSSKSSFREGQYDFCEAMDGVYLVSTADGGMTLTAKDMSMGKSLGFVHPTRKSAVALRCADAILANVFSQEDRAAFAAPKIVSVRFAGGTVTLTFDSDLCLLSGDRPLGFTLYCGSSWLDPASAVIAGKTLTLTAPSGKTPTEVRYGSDSICFEMESGSLIHNATFTYDEENPPTETVTFYVNGVALPLDIGKSGILRSTFGGNLTNASGIPLPGFRLSDTGW